MDEIVLFAAQPRLMLHHLAVTHESIFRVERHASGRYAQDVGFILSRNMIIGSDQVDSVAECAQLMAKSLDRGRDTVDAREIDIGDKKNFHGDFQWVNAVPE